MDQNHFDVTKATFDFIDRQRDFESLREVTDAYRGLVEPLGYHSFVAAQIIGPEAGNGPALRFGEWNPVWSSFYLANEYHRHDAAVQHAFKWRQPFTWDEVLARGVSKEAQQVFDTGREFGFAKGLVSPIHGAQGDLTTVVHMAEEAELPDRAKAAVHLGSIYFCEISQRLMARKDAPGRRTLSPRQAEILTLIARGMTRDDIGHKLKISAATVTQHVEEAKHRLERPTTMQAVVCALMSGEIRP